MNGFMMRLLLVVAVMVWAASLGWTQAAPRGTVNGSVTGANGPVVGAKVIIVSAVSAYTSTATTDQKGQFSFSDAPVGGVEVRVYDAGGNVVVTGNGELKSAGDVITLALQVP